MCLVRFTGRRKNVEQETMSNAWFVEKRSNSELMNNEVKKCVDRTAVIVQIVTSCGRRKTISKLKNQQSKHINFKNKPILNK